MERWGKNGIQYCRQIFYRAIQKHGWDNIKHEILYENLTEREAKSLERKLIKQYKTKDSRYGYNCTYGGDGTVGYKMTKESIEKSNKWRYKKVYQYSNNGDFIREWNSIKLIEKELGYSNTVISACCNGREKTAYGYLWTHEYFDKLEPVKLGHGLTVYQYSLDGKFIRDWDSAESVEKELGFIGENIRDCCKGKQKSSHGFIWKDKKYESVEPIKKVVYHQYDFDGNYIQSFDSLAEANKKLGYNHLPITKVCEGERQQAGGFLWSYKKEDKIEPYVKNNCIAITQFALDGEFITEWKSIDEATKALNKKGNNISKCIIGEYSTAYGYVWRKKGEPFDKYTIRKGRGTCCVQCDLNGKEIQTFESIRDACLSLGKEPKKATSSIVGAITGKQKTAYGYIWKYKDQKGQVA